MIGIKYTVRHTVQLAFYGTTGLIVGVTGLTLFENQLPLDYRNRIDHLKTQFLTNDIFEEHRAVLNIFGQSVDRLGSYHPRSKVRFRPLTRVKLLWIFQFPTLIGKFQGMSQTDFWIIHPSPLKMDQFSRNR